MLNLTAQNLIEADPRPTFVIELYASDVANKLSISYSNKAFKVHHDGSLPGHHGIGKSNDEEKKFKTWALAGKAQESGSFPFEYAGSMWTYFDATSEHATYRIFSANSSPALASTPVNPSSIKSPNYNGATTKTRNSANKTLRERLNNLTPELEAHLSLIERSDWSQAGFGEISAWPPELLEISRMTLMMPKPAMVLVGNASIMLYNLAYADNLLGPRHPHAMAMPIDGVWPEVITTIIKE